MRLDRRKFETWLKTKPATASVGERRHSLGCPIANFYAEISGGCEVVIWDSGGDYLIDRGSGARLLPWWAARFVFLVDGSATREITAGHALEILAEIQS